VVATAFLGILAAVASAITGMTGGPPTALPSTMPTARSALQADLNLAQHAIDAPSSSPAAIRSAAQFEQLATQALEQRPRAEQRAIVSGLSAAAAKEINTNLDAAAEMSRLSTPRSLPAWRIEPAPAPSTLLGYFRAAQARTRVPWEYLAAIEFVETSFGRVHGLSTAGAEGPMQFLPATWARYGQGQNVQDPRDAVFGAARYLTANGAPRDMADALYHYNPSADYVRAVTDYALRLRADPHAYYAYYWWRVVYVRRGRLLVLPVGYPKMKPVELTSPATPRSG
jgi:membrane-bound lytic murein transglycosylase B